MLWFDAHGDFNTPETTVGGFLDGMSLATTTGRCWTQLAASIPGFQPAAEERVALIGARDLDPLEAAALDRSTVRRVTASGLLRELPALLGDMGPGPAYLHVDLDVLDPREVRVNPYAAPAGLSRADLHWAIDAIGQRVVIGAAALTAYDPVSDAAGTGSEAALTPALAVVTAAGNAGGPAA